VKLASIAEHLGCTLDPAYAEVDICSIADPQDADVNSITFVSSPKYLPLAQASKAGFVIVKNSCAIHGKVCLEVKDPYLAFAKIAQLFEDRTPLFDGPVHPTAIIHKTAQIGEGVFIGPYSVIGKNCRIGKGSVLGAHCVIENDTLIGEYCRIDSAAIIRRQCAIGNCVIIQSGAVIGSEGFGNAKDGDRFVRIPSFGAVIIEDDAEIGANTTIDRGTFKPTRIGRGVRIDNLVQIAHNVVIEENSAMAAQVGISGSTHIGKRVVIGGQAGFVGHIKIADDSFVNAQSGVTKDTEPKAKITGTPARDFLAMRRIEAAQEQLPELARQVKRLRLDFNDILPKRESRENPSAEL